MKNHSTPENPDLDLVFRDFDNKSKHIFETTEVEIQFDRDANRHIVLICEYNNFYGTIKKTPLLELPVSQGKPILGWLMQQKNGKTRLWYIIRDWNENKRNVTFEPFLFPDIPLLHLLSKMNPTY